MVEKYNALMANGTWDLVPPQSSQNLVESKWVYKLKYQSDGYVKRYKVHLIAQGFYQQAGIDYHETFYPIVKPTIVHLILSLVVSSECFYSTVRCQKCLSS